MMTGVKQYWNQRSVREQKLLFGAGFCLFFYLFYVFLYSPLVSGVSHAKTQLIENKTTLNWMMEARQLVSQQKKSQNITQGQLLTILGEQINQASFHRYPYQLAQIGSGDIQLSFDEVPYNAWVIWLWKLNQQYHFSVKQFNAEITKTPGVVKALVIITPL